MIVPYTDRRRLYRRCNNPFGLGLLVVGALVLAGFLYQAVTAVWAVKVGGRQVAVVEERRDAERVLEALEKTYGADEIFDQVKLVRTPRWPGSGQVVRPSEAENRLAEALGLQMNAVGVAIDGKVKFYFADRSKAQAFLDQLKKKYPADPEAEVGFLQDVSLKETKVTQAVLCTVEEAVEKATEAQRQNKDYRIKDGDTLWDIASAHDLSVKELLAANPGLKENDTLALGQHLNVGKIQPPLTVVSKARLTESVAIPYPVTVKKDSSVALGKCKVVKPGSAGEKEIVVEVTRYNGRAVSRKAVAATVVKQPVAQVEARGTRLLVASRGGTQLAWPARGPITSGYGMRWGKMHAAIDIGAGYGAPVVAAEAGQVISVGYNGGYGLTVEIAHGGGVTTRYAHLSRAGVDAGEEVGRGERIGSIGSSGNSTGPHLHFEVRKNGTALNPLNYL